MAKKKLSAEDQKLWDGELAKAEKYMTTALRFKGPIKYVDDGQQDVIVELPWSNVVRLLAAYGINRLCETIPSEPQS